MLDAKTPQDRQKELGQYFTPVWAAELLVETFFSDLRAGDVVVEPTCGDGRFLQVIPQNIHAIGVEIDPVHASAARSRTGRKVITGDFRDVALPFKSGEVDVLIGNPPYTLATVDDILERAKELLHPRQGRVGFVLPAYSFQTPSRVMRYAADWKLDVQMIPRTLFPGLSKPLVFAMFRREGAQWNGFALYSEAVEIEAMPAESRSTLTSGCGSVWRQAVLDAVESLGGEASLQEIYAKIGPRRPTATTWWKEKVRQVARQSLSRIDTGRYAIATAA